MRLKSTASCNKWSYSQLLRHTHRFSLKCHEVGGKHPGEDFLTVSSSAWVHALTDTYSPTYYHGLLCLLIGDINEARHVAEREHWKCISLRSTVVQGGIIWSSNIHCPSTKSPAKIAHRNIYVCTRTHAHSLSHKNTYWFCSYTDSRPSLPHSSGSSTRITEGISVQSLKHCYYFLYLFIFW